MPKKFALVHMGNDELYSLVFVAGELLKHEHSIEWFDGDMEDVVDQMEQWGPDFVCFSPLTTYFEDCLRVSRDIKNRCSGVRTVFGGHHIFAVPESIDYDEVDIVVIGPVYGVIEEIISCPSKSVLKGTPIVSENMFPARHEYYRAIPRIAQRHRKYIMSHFGCMYNCSYCATSFIRSVFGSKVYNDFWMRRRPVSHLIDEAKILMEYDTKEVSLEDDDVLAGQEAEAWLEEFIPAWKREINLPMYANVTPMTIIKASDKVLEILSEGVASVQMGVQTARPESLKLFNRGFQKEDQVKKAYDRLNSFGIKVKIEVIIGLPVDDPVEDALDTVKMIQRVASGTFVSCFPLMLYPGTTLYKKCRDEKIELNEMCRYEWHTGEGAVKFDKATAKKIKNITKMATMFVKYNIEEQWMRALIDMDSTDSASKQLSQCQYLESLVFRQGKDAVDDFAKVLSGMQFRY
ncbi:MAG: radical SAM protein [Planctomycetes bacterium]|nr:radical SAM protein [Planctomycetota bacterium]